MEPVGVGSKEEYLYDCYTLSHIQRSFDGCHGSEIRRKTNWVPINPFGEAEKQITSYDGGSQSTSSGKGTANLPSYESFDLNRSSVLDEETFSMETGIVFFEVGFFCFRLHFGVYESNDMVYAELFLYLLLIENHSIFLTFINIFYYVLQNQESVTFVRHQPTRIFIFQIVI